MKQINKTEARTHENHKMITISPTTDIDIVKRQPSETDSGGSRHLVWGPSHLSVVEKIINVII